MLPPANTPRSKGPANSPVAAPRSYFLGRDLAEGSPAEQALLAEDTDLEPWEKHRILSAARCVEMGEYMELLQLTHDLSAEAVKRAYRALSKGLHPDQYYGRRLGGFQPVLEHVFKAVHQFVRALSDPRTATPTTRRAGGPTRRRFMRYTMNLPVQVVARSWTGTEKMISRDISAGGAFLMTRRKAVPGEEVGLMFDTEFGTLAATGNVVCCRTPEDVRGTQEVPGVGIRFARLQEQQKERLTRVLEMGRENLPLPAASQLPEPRQPRVTQRVHRSTPIIGIDLGTTNTSVSGSLGNRVHVFEWANGQQSIPSVVAFVDRSRCVVGPAAKQQLLRDPRYAIASCKRLLGRNVDDPDITPLLGGARFAYEAGPDGTTVAQMRGETYAMPQLCSYLFAAAKHTAERALQGRVSKAVLTVPVSFAEKRVAMLRRAAAMAHLDVVAVIEEPSAAALANCHDKSFSGIVGVYDFGGGTFDFSLVEANGGDLRVLATAGDSWLGGDDFDLALADAAANRFWRAYDVDLRNRTVEWQQLVTASEVAKRRLSTANATQLFVPGVLRTKAGMKDLRIGVRRETVEPIWQDAIDRSMTTCMQAFALAGVPLSKLSAIYLSGGTSYIPAIQNALAHRFGVPVRIGVPVEHAVCTGAGVHAAQLERRAETVLTERS